MKVSRSLLLLPLLVVCSFAAHAACPAFTPQSRYPTGATSPYQLLSADFNHDGKLDVAAMSEDSVSFELGNGDGSFAGPGHTYRADDGAWTFTQGDVNLDGTPDVATVNIVANTVSVFVGNGDGTATASTFPVMTTPLSIVIADFTSDGKPDIAVGSYEGGISVYAGDGNGGFAAARIKAIASVATPLALATADFNGDGKNDLLAMLGERIEIVTYFGRGNGTFDEGEALRTSPGGVGQQLVLGDFNRDQILDAVLGSGATPDILVFLGKGGGAFRFAGSHAADRATISLAVDDFTNDGNLDFVASSEYAPGLKLFVGHGNGTFDDAIYYERSAISFGVASGDFTGDRKPDIVFVDYLASDVGILKNTGDCGGDEGTSKRRSARH